MSEHCYRALLPSIANEQWHVRTDVTNALRTYSPSRNISPFVTRGRAYGIEVWS